jgi:hypothetical protein
VYVEQVAFAVAVGAAETACWFVFFAYEFGGFAFFGFVCFFEEHLCDFCCVVVKQVVDVPEFVFIFSEVALYSFFQAGLRGANVGVQAFFEGYFAFGAYVYVDVFGYLDD